MNPPPLPGGASSHSMLSECCKTVVSLTETSFSGWQLHVTLVKEGAILSADILWSR